MFSYVLYETTEKGRVIHSFKDKRKVVELLNEKLSFITSIYIVTSKDDVIELCAIQFLLLFKDFIEFK